MDITVGLNQPFRSARAARRHAILPAEGAGAVGTNLDDHKSAGFWRVLLFDNCGYEITTLEDWVSPAQRSVHGGASKAIASSPPQAVARSATTFAGVGASFGTCFATWPRFLLASVGFTCGRQALKRSAITRHPSGIAI